MNIKYIITYGTGHSLSSGIYIQTLLIILNGYSEILSNVDTMNKSIIFEMFL